MDLKAERKLKGITLKEASEHLGISIPTLSRWEKDSSKINKSKIEVYEEFLKNYSENKNEVTIKVKVPTLTEAQVNFIETLTIDTLSDKIGALGYINYVLRSSKTKGKHYHRGALLQEWQGSIQELTELLGEAVLAGKWNYPNNLYFMVKLPTGQYLQKYKDSEGKITYGYSVSKDSFTVHTLNKDELEIMFPEYKDFIVQENYSPSTPKVKKGYIIYEKPHSAS